MKVIATIENKRSWLLRDHSGTLNIDHFAASANAKDVAAQVRKNLPKKSI
jgi:hypothetical protein